MHSSAVSVHQLKLSFARIVMRVISEILISKKIDIFPETISQE